MTRQKFERFGLLNAELVNQAMNDLPIARESAVIVDGIEQKEFKAIVVDNEVVDIPSNHYYLVQHKDAFRPIIEGITQAGIMDFKFNTYATKSKAYFNVFLNSVSDGTSKINVGISVSNSYDRTMSLNCGFKLDSQNEFIEIVGYRQVCSNGLKMRVPLSEAEFVRPELRQEIKTLISKSLSIKHNSGIVEKMLDMQYMSEAFALIREPLQLYIEKAKKIDCSDITKVEKMISQHFSERMRNKIVDRFNADAEVEGKSLWGLFNALTYVASHNATVTEKERIENKAQEILSLAIAEVA